jgi:hypothetical protein
VKVEVTDNERDFLHELLEEKQARLIQEIDHTDTRNFEELLRRSWKFSKDSNASWKVRQIREGHGRGRHNQTL